MCTVIWMLSLCKCVDFRPGTITKTNHKEKAPKVKVKSFLLHARIELATSRFVPECSTNWANEAMLISLCLLDLLNAAERGCVHCRTSHRLFVCENMFEFLAAKATQWIIVVVGFLKPLCALKIECCPYANASTSVLVQLQRQTTKKRSPKWKSKVFYPIQGSNLGPPDWRSSALPTELTE